MIVRPPSLRSIAAFEAAARHRSFTRAGAELNLTTSAISHAVKMLEERLDRRLFERSGRKVTLTPEGQSLAARVRLSLALLGDAFETRPWLSHDCIIVSALPSVAQRILVPGLSRLRTTLPGVSVELRCSSALSDLDEEADIAIRFGPGGWSGLESVRLADETLFPVASPHYRNGELPRSLEEMRSCTLIHHPESAWHLWLDALGWKLDQFRSELLIDDAGLVIDAAAEGLGIGLARAHLVATDLRAGRLVRLFEHDVPAEYSYWAVWNGGSAKRKLIDAIAQWAKSLFDANVAD